MGTTNQLLAGLMIQQSKFHIYKDKQSMWRWRLVASNGKTIADGSEGYVNKADCQHGISLVKQCGGAEVIED